MRRHIIWLFVSALGFGAAQAQEPPFQAQEPSLTEARPTQAPVQIDTGYDFFEHAASAYWQSSRAGRLPFPGQEGDQRGFARQLSQATLSTGEPAEKLLQSHPEGRGRGWIQAIYPPLIIGDGMKFRALIGFLEGTEGSDGARFSMQVREGRQRFRLLSHTLKADQSEHLQADLSRWAGKTISIILRVNAGTSAVNDRAVWVNPRLEVKP